MLENERANRGAGRKARSDHAIIFRCIGADGAGVDIVQFITFAIGDDHYGIDIMAVREIKDWTAIRHLPNQPDYVRGICGLRGAFIPIIDLRCRFGQGLTQPTPLHVIIIVQIGQQQVGLLADRVSDIISVERANIKAVPEVEGTRGSRIPVRAGEHR